jgi:hypothetical protein
MLLLLLLVLLLLVLVLNIAKQICRAFNVLLLLVTAGRAVAALVIVTLGPDFELGRFLAIVVI